MKQGWKNYLLYSSIVLVLWGLIYILVETIKAKNTGFETKTLWDWMELLIIPAVLTGGALLLNRSERNTEREIATDRQQETALQTYFDRMSELLLNEKLRTTKKVEVRDVARTRTVSILRTLNTRRKDLVIQFLREAKIITDEKSILNKANMSEMDFQDLDFSDSYLMDAFLKKANLQNTFLVEANLQGAILNSANLQGAILWKANLKRAQLMVANLQGANLDEANLWRASLARANLEHASLGGTNLERVNLWRASLEGADLERVKLLRAILQGANLKGANLKGADLTGADLTGAKNITNQQLATVKSLKGTTMPDGTKHE